MAIQMPCQLTPSMPPSSQYSSPAERAAMPTDDRYTPRCRLLSSSAKPAPSRAFTAKIAAIEQRIPSPPSAGAATTSFTASAVSSPSPKAAAAASAIAARMLP